MYVQFFGLSSDPFFDGMAQDEAVFKTDAVVELDRDLAIALSRKDAVAILSGMSGTGKTTLAADALKNISTRLAFTCITQAPETSHELLEQLLSDFGSEPYKKSRVERLLLWKQFLSEMAATDTRVCLLVENADEFSVDVLQSLHKLTAADAAMTPGANLILTTTLPPERLLATDEMLGFNQRVRLRRRIEPLSRQETGAYLTFKCALGGADAGQLLAPDFASTLFGLSSGVIRIVDSLLESTMQAAASVGERQISTDRLIEVAAQQFGIRQMAPDEVDALLQAEPQRQKTGASGARKDPVVVEDIPTLTDFVGEPEFRLDKASSN